MVKTDPERVKTVIYLSLQITANLAIAFEPFLPFSSKRLRQMMGEESQGMILSAVNYNGNLSVTTTLEEVKGGSQVG